MKAEILPFVGLQLLHLVAARAPLHKNHQHLHEKRAPEVVQEVVTDNQYIYYDSANVIVYEDADGKPLSTVTSWNGQRKTSASSISPATDAYTPPPAPTSTASSSAPPPPPPPAAEEKMAQHPYPVGSASSAAAPSSPPAPQSSAAAPASSSSAPSTSSSGGGGAGAKGVAYNTPAQATQVSGIAWACNWGQKPDLDNPPFEYVPQLWGKKDGMADSFAANAAGAKNLLFYNEPDMDQSVGGSGIDVGTAITDFTNIMKPLQAQGKAVSTPCVANSDSGYLETFLEAFPNGSIDILCFHWYGPDLNGLQGTVDTFQALASKHGVKQMWMNEWAVQPPPNDLSSFTSYLNGKVDRYAYNMNDMAGSTGY